MTTSMSAAEYAAHVRRHWSEATFTTEVIRAASDRGWMAAHFRPARTSDGWRTPMQGHAGFPDLCLARGGITILAELKSEKGQAAKDRAEKQQAWLDASDGYLWRPSDWPQIMELLA